MELEKWKKADFTSCFKEIGAQATKQEEPQMGRTNVNPLIQLCTLKDCKIAQIARHNRNTGELILNP